VIKHLVGISATAGPIARLDDLIVGNAVPEAEQGMQMGRMISLLSLPVKVPGMIVNTVTVDQGWKPLRLPAQKFMQEWLIVSCGRRY
jgi:acetyl-CoA acetyltransferase